MLVILPALIDLTVKPVVCDTGALKIWSLVYLSYMLPSKVTRPSRRLNSRPSSFECVISGLSVPLANASPSVNWARPLYLVLKPL